MAASNDIYNFFASLSPAEQQQFMYSFGTQDQGLNAYDSTVPDALAGPGAPTTDPSSLDLSGMIGGALPQLTTKGKVDPFDLTQAGQRLNYTQDVGGSMFDVAQALFAGPDAWGNSQQFQPVVKYSGQATPAAMDDQGNPVPVTKAKAVLNSAKSAGGYRGYLANLVDQGVDPDTAVSMMRDVVTNASQATNLDPETKKQVDEIRNTMRVWRTNDPITGTAVQVDRKSAPWESFDEDDARKVAQDLYDQKTGDDVTSSTLQFDPKTQQYYANRTEEPSAAAQKFINAGLPLPTETYNDPSRIQAGWDSIDPNWMGAEQTAADQQGSTAQSLADRQRNIMQGAGQISQYDQQLQSQSKPYQFWEDPQVMAAMRQAGGPQRFVQGGPQQAPLPTMAPKTGMAGQYQPPPQQQFDTAALRGRAAPAPQQHAQGADPLTALLSSHNGGQQVMRNSQGELRVPTQANPFDFSGGLLGMVQQPVQQRNAQQARSKNQADTKQWIKDYNANWNRTQNKPTTSSSADRQYLAGMMRGRAQDATPLQDTMLARLMSLKARAGL